MPQCGDACAISAARLPSLPARFAKASRSQLQWREPSWAHVARQPSAICCCGDRDLAEARPRKSGSNVVHETLCLPASLTDTVICEGRRHRASCLAILPNAN